MDNNNVSDNDNDMYYDYRDNYYKYYDKDKHGSDELDGYYGNIQKFTNYEELLSLTEQEDTKHILKNIVFALIKAVKILKCKEVSFKFDFKFGSYDSWVDISDYFNTNYVGTDYRILIDEDTIVCILLNDKLIE
jgi:hypothetical protein